MSLGEMRLGEMLRHQSRLPDHGYGGQCIARCACLRPSFHWLRLPTEGCFGYLVGRAPKLGHRTDGL